MRLYLPSRPVPVPEASPKGGDYTKAVFQRIWVKVSGSVAAFAAALWALMAWVVPAAATNPTTDAINSTVSLIQVLLIALLPLVILVALFSFIMGLFTGEHGVFSKLGRQ